MNSHYVKSSVLGNVVYVHRGVTQSTNTGQYSEGTIRDTKVYLGEKLLAVSQSTSSQQYETFRWSHSDPSAATVVETKPNGQGTRFELDPFGTNVGLESPYGGGNPDPPVSVGYGEMGSPEAIEWVEVDGVWAPANYFPGMIASASRCPRQGCGPIHTANGFEYWTAFADGYEGYMPMGANYAGYGRWTWDTGTEYRPPTTPPTFKKRPDRGANMAPDGDPKRTRQRETEHPPDPEADWPSQVDKQTSGTLKVAQGKSIGFKSLFFTLQNCIETLWQSKVRLESFLRAKAFGNGKMVISYAGSDGRLIRQPIITDATTNNADQLTKYVNAFNAGKWSGAVLPTNGQRITGTTFSGPGYIDGVFQNQHPWRNYVANNASSYSSTYPVLEASLGKIVVDQIHEDGNSIANILRINVGNPNDVDTDSGKALETCVAKKLTGGK